MAEKSVLWMFGAGWFWGLLERERRGVEGLTGMGETGYFRPPWIRMLAVSLGLSWRPLVVRAFRGVFWGVLVLE